MKNRFAFTELAPVLPGSVGQRPAEVGEGRRPGQGELDLVQHTPDAETEGAIWKILNGHETGNRRQRPRKSTYVESTSVSQGLERVREAAKRDVVRGFFNYHAASGNMQALTQFRGLVTRAWCRELRRRCHKGRRLTLGLIRKLEATWLPRARVLHPYPNQRLRAIYPR